MCFADRTLALLVAGLVLSAHLGFAQTGSPAGPVPVERLAARRAALLDSIGQGVAVVGSGAPRSIEGDYPQDSDYRESNDFFYLTGLEAPGSWLVLMARDSAPDETILFLPPVSAASRWTGRGGLPAADAAHRTGIADVRPTRTPEEEIESLVFGDGSPARTGRLLLPRTPRHGESELVRRLVFSAGRYGPAVTVADLGARMAQLRLVKDPEELRRLRRAVSITGQALQEVMAFARPGMYEYEIEARIEYVFRREGAERVGFPSIVGSGPNGTILHYDRNRRRTVAGDLVVMDVGAEFGYLTADVTRTIPISGRFTGRQRALYELVLGSQQAALDLVRPGVTLAALNQKAREHMRARSGTLCGTSSCDRYFVHGLSHWLGMDVHDVGSTAAPLAPGMVLTVEPGIYLPEEGVGIRIEDVVAVTDTGYELLSAGVPRTAAEVERAMQRR